MTVINRNELKIQFERLRRHYAHVKNVQDEIALLDLVSSLRVWMDLKPSLEEFNIEFRNKQIFTSSTPDKKLLNNFKTSTYFYAYINDNVSVLLDKEKGMIPFSVSSKIKDDFIVFFAFSIHETKSASILQFDVGKSIFYADRSVDKKHNNKIESPRQSNLNFTRWLGSEFIRINIPKEGSDTISRVILTREDFVRRVANYHTGASHPKTTVKESPDPDKDDKIEFLYNFTAGNLPLIYFLVMSIAQDMIKNLPRILK